MNIEKLHENYVFSAIFRSLFCCSFFRVIKTKNKMNEDEREEKTISKEYFLETICTAHIHVYIYGRGQH